MKKQLPDAERQIWQTNMNSAINIATNQLLGKKEKQKMR
jgi:hypothetical protein